MLSQVTKGAMW